MNLILTISSVVLFVILLINQIIKYRRFKFHMKLESIYDEMEMFFVRKNIPIDTKYLELLRIHKNVVVNPELLDVQLLLLIKFAAEKSGQISNNKSWFEKTIHSLPPDFLILIKEFDKGSDMLIRLSMLKPDFLLFTLKLIMKNALKKRMNSIREDIRFAINNESVLLRTGRQM